MLTQYQNRNTFKLDLQIVITNQQEKPSLLPLTIYIPSFSIDSCGNIL